MRLSGMVFLRCSTEVAEMIEATVSLGALAENSVLRSRASVCEALAVSLSRFR